MKRRFNTGVVSMAFIAALAACLPPSTAHAQVSANVGWVQSSAQGPSARAGAAMDFDTARGRSYMFGGSDGSSSYLSDTWQFDGATWSQLQASGPSARYLALMAFDSARGVSVLFGGYGNGVKSDTWEWDGAAWTQKVTN